jgi:hypothetical protein
LGASLEVLSPSCVGTGCQGSTRHLQGDPRGDRVLLDSFSASSVFLEQVVQRVTTMWTTGGRVGVSFILPLKHRGIRYRSGVSSLWRTRAGLSQFLFNWHNSPNSISCPACCHSKRSEFCTIFHKNLYL